MHVHDCAIDKTALPSNTSPRNVRTDKSRGNKRTNMLLRHATSWSGNGRRRIGRRGEFATHFAVHPCCNKAVHCDLGGRLENGRSDRQQVASLRKSETTPCSPKLYIRPGCCAATGGGRMYLGLHPVGVPPFTKYDQPKHCRGGATRHQEVPAESSGGSPSGGTGGHQA